MDEREREKQRMAQEADAEWEGRIKELTAKFDADMAKKGKKDKKVWWQREESIYFHHCKGVNQVGISCSEVGKCVKVLKKISFTVNNLSYFLCHTSR